MIPVRARHRPAIPTPGNPPARPVRRHIGQVKFKRADVEVQQNNGLNAKSCARTRYDGPALYTDVRRLRLVNLVTNVRFKLR